MTFMRKRLVYSDNQEDSVLINNSAIEKGLFRAQALKKYYEAIKKNPASSQTGIFMKPDRNKVDNLKDANYDKLTEEGYARVETVIKDGDVIIGLVNPKPTSREDDKPYKDNSTIYKSLVPGAIDKVLTEINNDGYPIIKIRARSERIPAVGDKFSCYDKETEVLTDKGWIPFEDLTRDHKVATLVNSTELVYEHPLAIQKFHYKGKMYQVKSRQIDLCVTPNHKMWVAPRSKIPGAPKVYRLERADEIEAKGRYYKKNVSQYGCEAARRSLFTLPACQRFPERKLDMHAWLLFFGIWMAEGCTLRDWAVTFSAHKQRVKDELSFVCDVMGFEIHYHFDRKEDGDRDIRNIWQIPDKQLVHYMRPLSVGATNKTLPEWVWDLTTVQARWLIHGMMLGDGHWMDNGTRRYDTSSKKLANDFQRLCLHAGWSANMHLKYKKGYVTTIKGHIATNTADAWRLTVVTDQNMPQVNIKHHYDGWVDYNDSVYCCTTTSGVIYVRRNYVPTFSGNSRSGQKGTCGYKPNRADLPFTKTGLIPDIIINPNAIPKRMTIGQLAECLLSKVCAIKGVYGDATPFTGININKINAELIAGGYEEWGNETMYNGITGQKMHTKIFIGPTYYQRLKQMVGDKAHSRARGPQQLLTRQPPEGRSREGGLRIGEMERDAMAAHGIAQFIKERMVDNSDSYTVHVCDRCGLLAHKVPDKRYYICRSCQNTTRISKIIIPYPFKLFMQELQSINILARIRTSKSVISLNH